MIINSERLTLRPVTLDDFKTTHQILSDPEVMRFSLNGPTVNRKPLSLLITVFSK